MRYLIHFKNLKQLIDEANDMIQSYYLSKNKFDLKKIEQIMKNINDIKLDIFEDEINDPDFKLNLFTIDILTSIKIITFEFEKIKYASFE